MLPEQLERLLVLLLLGGVAAEQVRVNQEQEGAQGGGHLRTGDAPGQDEAGAGGPAGGRGQAPPATTAPWRNSLTPASAPAATQ